MHYWKIYTVKLWFADGKTDTTSWPCLIKDELHISGEVTLEKVQSFYSNFTTSIVSKIQIISFEKYLEL